MHHLHQTVHTGIGAAGADRRHGLVGKGAERLFQPILHRLTVRLRLPAVERAAVIRDAESQALGVILHSGRCRLLAKPTFSSSLPADRGPDPSEPRWHASRPRPADLARLRSHRSA